MGGMSAGANNGPTTAGPSVHTPVAQPGAQGTVTIGVSFDIPADLAERVSAARHEVGDPFASLVRPHITLLPPTPVREKLLIGVLDHLYRVFSRTAAFDVVLRGTDTFRPVSPVVFLPLVEGGRRCSRLAAEVRSGPLDVELAFPYHPHVTVAQNVDDEALDAAAAKLADVNKRFTARGARVDLQQSDGSWSPHSAFEFSASAKAPRRGFLRRPPRRR